MRRSQHYAPLTKRILIGAGLGALLATVCLLVGLGNFALHRLLGASIEPMSGDDARMVFYYVGGFVLAGALVGVLRPALATPGAIYVVLAMGGAIVMNALAIADGGIAGIDLAEIAAMTLIGAAFGVALAYGWLRVP